MPDLDTLKEHLSALILARARGVSKVRQGDEEVLYRTDAELAHAIGDLKRQIAQVEGSGPIRTVRFTTSKGL